VRRSEGPASAGPSHVIAKLAALALVATTSALGAGNIEGIRGGALPNYDSRTGTISPTAAQLTAVDALGATATWNDFGTVRTASRLCGSSRFRAATPAL